ncbi:Mu transposase domain-containing protein [Nocardia sp. NPDC004278]
MTALPPIGPAVEFTCRARLPRDYYLRVLGNDYSIDPTVIGWMVDGRADLDAMTARCNGLLVATHRRTWSKALTITDPEYIGRLLGCEIRSSTSIPVTAMTMIWHAIWPTTMPASASTSPARRSM